MPLVIHLTFPADGNQKNSCNLWEINLFLLDRTDRQSSKFLNLYFDWENNSILYAYFNASSNKVGELPNGASPEFSSTRNFSEASNTG